MREVVRRGVIRSGVWGLCSSLAFTLAFALIGAPALAALDPVQVEGFVSVDRARPGDAFQVAVRLSMEPGWHTQSHVPSEETFIPTELHLELSTEPESTSFLYPEGHLLDAPELGGQLSVYDDGVIFGADVQLAADAPAGEHTIQASVRYQACNERACLFPKTKDVSLTLTVDPRADGATSLHPEIFAALLSIAATSDPDSSAIEPGPAGGIADEIRSSGFSLWLVTVFLLGLGLNLTPCVYPVIAVTVTYFGRQEGGPAARVARSSAYAAGIGLTFTTLFLVAGLTGQLFGAWLQNPWVLGALALVLIALALSNFGLFELQAPAALRNRVAGGKSGVGGAVMMGLAMGVVAAPCVGPLIATLLLWVGQQGDLWNALLVGLALSGGLALPYVVLGFFSGSLASLPRSGDWMEWLKHAMGFLLFGVALYFLTSFLPDHWFLPSFAALAVIAGVWLALIDRAGRTNRVVWFLRGAVFVSSLVAAFGLIRLGEVEGIRWEPYTAQAVVQAADRGEPVIIDYTAAWCVPCRVMEHRAFKDPQVVSESRRFVRLQVDLTNQKDPASQDAVVRFEVAGPPTIVFLDPAGEELARLRVLESVGAGELLERMQRVPGPRTASATPEPT